VGEARRRRRGRNEGGAGRGGVNGMKEVGTRIYGSVRLVMWFRGQANTQRGRDVTEESKDVLIEAISQINLPTRHIVSC
jgi:hypothetical protein